MQSADIFEFRTPWKNESFLKNKSAFLTTKRLIKKSITIVQARLCRQLKYAENNLIIQLQTAQRDKQLLDDYHHSTDNLQQRLQVLENEIGNYNLQIKKLVEQEKEYWKQLEQTIAKRTTNGLLSSNTRPIVVVNATFVIDLDKNNENIPPSECQIFNTEKKSPVKIRKRKKYIS